MARQGSPPGAYVRALNPTIFGCFNFLRISASNLILELYFGSFVTFLLRFFIAHGERINPTLGDLSRVKTFTPAIYNLQISTTKFKKKKYSQIKEKEKIYRIHNLSALGKAMEEFLWEYGTPDFQVFCSWFFWKLAS